MEKKIKDSQLGTILLRTHPRATRYSLKVTGQGIVATMPTGGNERLLLNFIEEQRDRLAASLQKQPEALSLSPETRLQTASFSVHIFCTERTNLYISMKEDVLHIACPMQTDFADARIQQLLSDTLQRALRHEARRLLPARLSALAAQYGFAFESVKINSSQGRWGSCSSRKTINLSLSLMLLPWHLIDYVLLHELCHTREMNHGERFWALMNKVTDGQARRLRLELKQHTTRLPGKS